MRVLAIDPALRNTGFGVVETAGRGMRHVASGIIRNPPDRSHTTCLLHIHDEIAALVARHQPDCCAVEGIIYVQSHRTAITLGAARGAALIALARTGLSVHEYAPRRVKQAVVGKGGAQKEQVSFMVRALLGMTGTPAADEADALAIGIAHLQALASPAQTAGGSIKL